MRAKLVMAAAVLASLAAGVPALRAQPAPAVGLWQATDPDTHQPSAWFYIRDDNGVFVGIIAKMFPGSGDDPNPICDKCTDDRRDQKAIGLQIIRGMKLAGDGTYQGGTILDPRDGKIYDAKMTVSPDGQTLTLRGYIGISLLGRNEYWKRLPDSDLAVLDPSIKALLPKPAADPRHPPLRR